MAGCATSPPTARRACFMDVLRHGVLSEHPGRYRVRLIDAMEPDEYLLGDAMFHGEARHSKPLRAVISQLLARLSAGGRAGGGARGVPAENAEPAVEVKQLCVAPAWPAAST